MRRSVATLALIALFASVPSFAAEATAVAPVEPSMAAPADAVPAPVPAAVVPAPKDGDIFYWLKPNTTSTVPEVWLLPPGCGAYCRACEGCCAIGPTWCACC